jgi:hypothetical protein
LKKEHRQKATLYTPIFFYLFRKDSIPTVTESRSALLWEGGGVRKDGVERV